jgi:hypothetical protein
MILLFRRSLCLTSLTIIRKQILEVVATPPVYLAFHPSRAQSQHRSKSSASGRLTLKVSALFFPLLMNITLGRAPLVARRETKGWRGAERLPHTGGPLGCSPMQPLLAFSLDTLELYHQIRHRQPSLRFRRKRILYKRFGWALVTRNVHAFFSNFSNSFSCVSRFLRVERLKPLDSRCHYNFL